MDDRGTVPPPRIGDARSRRQRRADTIQRYATALSRPSPSTSAVRNPSPAPQVPHFRGRLSGAVPSQSHLQRHRLRRQRDGDNFGTVQETVNDLDNDQRSNQLNPAALNQTLPVPAAVDEFTGLQETPESYGRRNKRRKLDSDALDALPKISYGYHGQVAPGRLNMMISYCDGGELHGDKQYSQNNILHNDKSVYCSRRSKVNLMLSHWGEVPFTCTKIVIKTPEKGFPAPVQEGMLFVFMGGNNMLENTSQFQLQDPCPHMYRRCTPPPPDPARLRTTLRLSNGPWRSASPDNLREPSTMIHDLMPTFDLESFLAEPTQLPRPETSSSLDDMPPLSRVPRHTSSLHSTSAYHDNISISCDAPSDDEEEPSAESVLEDRRRRAQQADTDSEGDEDGHRYSSSNRTCRQRLFSRPIEWTWKDPSTQAGEPPGADVPYTRFFIERKKHVVSIKFNPPVSGKHILLKLWSPQGRDHLDLQSVCVYGFAGPRFFPVIATR